MPTAFVHRNSDSPLIERIWSAHSQQGGRLMSLAAGHSELIVTRLAGRTHVNLRGPETVPTQADCPPEGEWLAIRFKTGTYFPQIRTASLLDGRDFDLPVLTQNRFVLNGTIWEIPHFDNAEALIQHWARAGLIREDALVSAAARGEAAPGSLRTLQRRFLAVTGLPLQTYQQIERARYAVCLLRAGTPILEAALTAGYCDQPHLTHTLKRLVGLTPGEIAAQNQALSFLYKKEPGGL